MNVSNVFSSTASWYHIAIVIKGNEMTLYVNGNKKGQITSKSYSGLTAFGDLDFGHSGNDQEWYGGVDDVRVWKKARTQSEIRDNMRHPIAMPALQHDLLAYLPIDTIQIEGKTCLREWVSGKTRSGIRHAGVYP